MATDWGGRSTWDSFTQTDPLFGGSSDWASMPQMYSYDQRNSASNQMSYAPSYGQYGLGYDPSSSFSSWLIDQDINNWMFNPETGEYLHLLDFESGSVNTGGGFAGNVSQNPSFGQFAQDPTVYAEIETAANKYGIPANLLKVMIARESSGHWGSGPGYDNTQLTWLGSRNQWIAGYTGITEAAATAWGYNIHDFAGNRALQIDAMANGLSRLYRSVGGQYGWEGVINTYYSGDPTGQHTPSDSYQYGTTSQYTSQVMSWWAQEDGWTEANGGQLYREGSSGMGSPDTGAWRQVNQWDSVVGQASSSYGVPANLLKAIARTSSENGNVEIIANPEAYITRTAIILQAGYNQHGSWERAAREFYGGDSVRAWRHVNAYWQELDASVSGLYGGPEGEMGPVTNISAVWGGIDGVTTTQRNGEVNEWTVGAGSGYYDYSTSVLGYANAHPGNDYGMPYNTRIFTPVGGIVEIAGGSGYYNDEAQMGRPQTGEIRIRLDNGHNLIFGHMAGIHVSAGDRVNPGQYVGLSGTAGSGPHLHLEYRIPDQSLSSGWRSIDPEDALRGAFSGTFSGRMEGAGISRPQTFAEMLRAGASGGTIYGGSTLGATQNTWNSWLQSAMRGEIPNRLNESVAQQREYGSIAGNRANWRLS